MMTELVAFYEARLAEDEAHARDAFGNHNDAGPDWYEQWSGALNIGEAEDLITTNDSQVSRFMARFDPARTIRDVATDRKLIARYKTAVDSHEGALQTLAAARKEWGPMSQETDDAYGDTITTSARAAAFLTILEDRAARFADHEDYQEAWRP